MALELNTEQEELFEAFKIKLGIGDEFNAYKVCNDLKKAKEKLDEVEAEHDIVTNNAQQLKNKIEDIAVKLAPNIDKTEKVFDETKTISSSLSALQKEAKIKNSVIEGLKTSNEELRKTLDSERLWVKAAIAAVLVVGTALFVHNWISVSNVAAILKGQIDSYKDHLGTFQTQLDSYTDRIDKQIELHDNRFLQIAEDTEKKLEDWDLEHSDAMTEITNNTSEIERQQLLMEKGIQVTRAIHLAEGQLALGQQRLIFNRDPRQARTYAENAHKVLTEAYTITGGDEIAPDAPGTPVNKTLNALKTAVLTVLAASSWEASDIKSTREYARDLKAVCDECIEGSHYLGLALLQEAIPNSLDTDTRNQKLNEAKQELLRTSNLTKNQNTDLVHLAAVYFAQGNFMDARETAKKFSNSETNGKNALVLYDDEKKAYLVIANIIERLSMFFNGDSPMIQPVVPACDCPVSLKESDGKIFLRLFEYARQIPTPDKNTSKNADSGLVNFLDEANLFVSNASGCAILAKAPDLAEGSDSTSEIRSIVKKCPCRRYN